MEQEFERKYVAVSAKRVIRNVEEVCQKVDGTAVGRDTRPLCNQVGKSKKDQAM